ncbi:MAG: hypothetical protein DRO14_01015 [Thermoprotei archaeon]|nr:MAG: hypothetical protein DRO14_01015 [Thermoprotei archaeon]
MNDKIKIMKISLYSLIVLSLLMITFTMYFHKITVSIGGLIFHIDNLSLPFIINAGLIGIAALVSSYKYMQLYEERTLKLPYLTLLFIFILTMMIIPMVRNWITFIFFWEVMTLLSYFLVIHDYKDSTVLNIGRNYFIIMHVLSTSALLLMFMFIRHSVGTYDFTYYSKLSDILLTLSLIGFGTKAGLFPLHFWLPQTHPVAPSPVSALLSGSMVKLGIYGLIRLITLMESSTPSWFSSLIFALAIMNIILAFIMYPLQKDVKKLFAWTTIGNIGWIMFMVASYAFGLENAVSIIGFYVLSHGLAKASVFILSGGVLYVYGTKDLNKVKGMIHSNKSLALLLSASILGLEGVPPSSLFLCKHDVVLKLLQVNLGLGIAVLINWVLDFHNIFSNYSRIYFC